MGDDPRPSPRCHVISSSVPPQCFLALQVKLGQDRLVVLGRLRDKAKLDLQEAAAADLAAKAAFLLNPPLWCKPAQ